MTTDGFAPDAVERVAALPDASITLNVTYPDSPEKPRVIWLLDIDGVVNVDSPEEHWEGEVCKKLVMCTPTEKPYWLFYSRKLIEEIWRIVDTYNVDLQLASTWNESPDDLFRVVLGREIPVAFPINGRFMVFTQKQKHAGKLVAQGIPLIWTDDDAVPDHYLTASTKQAVVKNCLALRPYWLHGLTPADITRIEEFLKALRDNR